MRGRMTIEPFGRTILCLVYRERNILDSRSRRCRKSNTKGAWLHARLRGDRARLFLVRRKGETREKARHPAYPIGRLPLSFSVGYPTIPDDLADQWRMPGGGVWVRWGDCSIVCFVHAEWKETVEIGT